MTDLTVVGAGLYGITVARLAAEAGRHVHLREARDVIGGNAASHRDPVTGIEVHTYGTHIWHNSNPRVQAWMERFTTFTPYRHTVHTVTADGRLLPLPLTLATVCAYLDRYVTPAEAAAWMAGHAATTSPESTLRGKAIRLIGKPLYEAMIEGYTAKQWDTDPDLLPAEVIARLPVRPTLDTGYFTDRWQGQPTDGLAAMIARMVDHPNITVTTGDAVDPATCPAPAVVTAPRDAWLGHPYRLGWRTLDFTTEVLAVGNHQGTAVLNYADRAVPYTRVHEFRHLHPERDYPADATVVAYEFSRLAAPGDEPYYPVNSPADRALLHDLRALTPRGVQFGGRLGTYQYLDMHMAVGSALTAWDTRISTLEAA